MACVIILFVVEETRRDPVLLGSVVVIEVVGEVLPMAFVVDVGV